MSSSISAGGANGNRIVRCARDPPLDGLAEVAAPTSETTGSASDATTTSADRRSASLTGTRS